MELNILQDNAVSVSDKMYLKDLRRDGELYTNVVSGRIRTGETPVSR
jgi:hypothetical protein